MVAEQEQRSIFGEGGLNSIFLPTGGGGEDKGAYDDWNRGIRGADSLPMDTPGEIALSSNLKNNKERQLMGILIELGEWQMTATCNLRQKRIAELSMELQQLSRAKAAFLKGETYEPPLSTTATSAIESTVYAMLPVIEAEEDLDAVVDRMKDIREETSRIREEIKRAKARGVYQDHSHLLHLYSQHDQWRTMNGAKHIESPFFLTEANDMGAQTASGFRWTHIQAVIARHVLGLNPQEAQQQRSTQGGWLGGTRRGENDSNQDR